MACAVAVVVIAVLGHHELPSDTGGGTESSRVERPLAADEVGSVATSWTALREPSRLEQESICNEVKLRLVGKLGPSMGELTMAEQQMARNTIMELHRHSEQELSLMRDSRLDFSDPEVVAKEADLMRASALWQAVNEALDQGQYWLGREFPKTLPRAEDGTHYQCLTVVHDGAAASAVFFIHDGIAAREFHGVGEYRNVQRLYFLLDAARRFNSLPDAERRTLYEQFVAAKARGGNAGVQGDMARMFPFENHVDEQSCIMRVPR